MLLIRFSPNKRKQVSAVVRHSRDQNHLISQVTRHPVPTPAPAPVFLNHRLPRRLSSRPQPFQPIPPSFQPPLNPPKPPHPTASLRLSLQPQPLQATGFQRQRRAGLLAVYSGESFFSRVSSVFLLY